MTDLTTRRDALLSYARSCLDAGDYHGCRDACTDLEVIEVKIAAKADTDYWHKRYEALRIEGNGAKDMRPGKPVCAACGSVEHLVANCPSW